MADDNFAQFLNEIFADDNSDSEFEGFDEDDLNQNIEAAEPSPINNENWVAGDRVPTPLLFTGSPGVNKDLTEFDVTSPLNFFEIFLTDDDLQDIVHQTNLYAKQQLDSKTLTVHSRFSKWVDTTIQEMRRFLALLIAMGLVSQLDLGEYWTTDPVTSTPFFSDCMPRDRFFLLLSFLHLNDNNSELNIQRGEEGHNPLFKLGRPYSNILYRFQLYYSPHQCLSIDECMVPWRGNLSFKTYNPDKPNKYGMKAYMLCDSDNGYCLRFKLYTGKSSVPHSTNGATYDLVMDLLRGHYGKGHVLYCDNYYSSPRLFLDLWDLGVGATGTVRSNRKGIPQSIKDITLKQRGETVVSHNGPLTVTKYLDSKPVLLLSTVSSSENVVTGKKDPKTGTDIKRPSVVIKYNAKMGGVDRSDQMIAYSKIAVKTLKWWKKVFFHMLSMVVLNSYIIYKASTTETKPMLFRVFRRKLVSQLVEKSTVAGSISKSVGRPSAKNLERLSGRHFLSKIQPTGTKQNVTRRCIVCTPAERELLLPTGEKRRRPGHDTSYCCEDCNVPLCVTPCFKLYHKYQEFTLAYKRQKLAAASTSTGGSANTEE